MPNIFYCCYIYVKSAKKEAGNLDAINLEKIVTNKILQQY